MDHFTHTTVDELARSDQGSVFHGHEHGATVSFFLSRTAPGRGPGLHTHPYEETFIVQEGNVRFRVGEQTVEATAGDLLVVPAGVPHGFVNSGSTPIRQMSIHPVARMETEWLEDQ